MIVVRLFGSKECPDCVALKNEMKENNIPFVLIDAFAVETQALCDLHEVDTIPHVQIMSGDKVLCSYIGPKATIQNITREIAKHC